MRYLQRVLLLLLVVFNLSQGYTQHQFKIKNYGKENGYILRGTITDVKQGMDKNIWIISNDGIARYDGFAFKLINTDKVEHNDWLRFYLSPNGSKYVTDIDNRIFFIERDTLRDYRWNDTIKKIAKGRLYSDLDFDEKNDLHIGFTRRSYFIIDTNGRVTDKFKNIPITGQVCVLRPGRMPFHFGRSNDSILKRANRRFFYLFDEKGDLLYKHELSKGIQYHFKSSAVKLSNGNYLFSTGKGHLFEFNRDSVHKEYDYPVPILSMLKDKRRNLWISTPEGIHHYQNEKVNPERKNVLMKGSLTIASELDYQEGIWIYSWQKGLNYIADPTVKCYRESNNLLGFDNVSALEVMGEKLFAGNEDNQISGVDLVKNKSLGLVFPLQTPEQQDYKSGILDLKYEVEYNKLLLTQRHNIFFLSESSWEKINTSQFQDKPYANRFFLKGNASIDSIGFVGSCKQRYFYGADTSILFVSDKYPGKVLYTLIDGDSAWVCSTEGVFLNRGDTIIDLKHLYPSLGVEFQNCTKFDGKIWFSSFSNGVYFLSNDKLEPLVSYKTKRTRMLSRGGNELWIFHAQGIYCLSSHGNKNHPSGLSISEYKALPLMGVSDFVSNENSIFWATENEGVMKIDFEDLKVPEQLLHLNIERIQINGRDTFNSGHIYELDYLQNYIRVSYNAVNFSDQIVKYRYRMKNRSNSWDLTKDRSLQFANLSPGKYIFQIQASLNGKDWSQSKWMFFNIAPPFWWSPWFIILLTFSFLFAVVLFVKTRIRVINKERDLTISRLSAEQKALRAKMDPHFIFNIISSVQYLIIKKENKKAVKFLHSFSRLTRDILDYSGQNYILLKDEIQSLKKYIELEYYRLGENFDYSISIEEGIVFKEEKIIPFIIQPFVENALLHGLKHKGEARKLNVYVNLKESFLEVIVEDNGIGRVAAKELQIGKRRQERSHGINIIKARLKLHNRGALKKNIDISDMIDSKGKVVGTRVKIYVKRIKNESHNN